MLLIAPLLPLALTKCFTSLAVYDQWILTDKVKVSLVGLRSLEENGIMIGEVLELDIHPLQDMSLGLQDDISPISVPNKVTFVASTSWAPRTQDGVCGVRIGSESLRFVCAQLQPNR